MFSYRMSGDGEAIQKSDDSLSRAEGRKLMTMLVLLLVASSYVIPMLLKGPAKTKPKVKLGNSLAPEVLIDLRKRRETLPEAPIPFKEDREIPSGAQDFVRDRLEDETFHYYVHMAHSLGKDGFKTEPETIVYESLATPEGCAKARGKVTKLRGRLVSYDQRVLNVWPNPSGLAWVWLALFHASDNHLYYVVITDKTIEPNVGRHYGDALEVEAVFAKGFEYTPAQKTRGEAIRLPVFVGHHFRKVRSKTYEEAYPWQLAWAMAVIMLVTCVAAALLLWFQSRGDKEFEKTHASLRQRRFKRKLGRLEKGNKAADNAKSAEDGNEARPAEDGNDAEPADDAKPAEGGDEAKAGDDAKPTEGGDEAKPADDAKPAEGGDEAEPTDDAKSAEGGDEAKPADDAKPAEGGDQAKAADDAKPAEGGDEAKPAEGGDEAEPADDAKPAEGGDEAKAADGAEAPDETKPDADAKG